MATFEDIHCSWCKGVIGVANEKQVLHVTEARVDDMGHFFHDSRERKCWSGMLKLSAHVTKHYKTG